jgi:hypothetical protein
VRWADQTAATARALLACFSSTADGSAPLDRATHSLRLGGSYDGLPLDTREEVASALRTVEILARRTESVAAEHRKQMRAPRAAPTAELNFVSALGRVFEDAFERQISFRTDQGERGGPTVRFIIAVAALIAKREFVNGQLPKSGIGASLLRLQSPTSVAERIRDLRSGGSTRKR